MNLIPRSSFILVALLVIAAVLLPSGCSSPEKPVASDGGTAGKPTPVVPAGPLKLEVDPALTQEGITVSEKARDSMKIVLVFGATKKDHDSSNYNRVLYAPDGKEISRTGMSIPRFAKDSTFEVEVTDDDLPKASRLLITPLGK